MPGCRQLWIAVTLEAVMVAAGKGADITKQEEYIAQNYCREILGIEPDAKFVQRVRDVVYDARGKRRAYYKGLRRRKEEMQRGKV
jgi:hypothetical protein